MYSSLRFLEVHRQHDGHDAFQYSPSQDSKDSQTRFDTGELEWPTDVLRANESHLLVLLKVLYRGRRFWCGISNEMVWCYCYRACD